MDNSKNKIKLLSAALILIFFICVPLFIISLIVGLIVDIPPLYDYCFEKYNISEATDLDMAQLKTAGNLMGNYLSGKISSPQITVRDSKHTFELYNTKELMHLSDVRKIFQIFQNTLVVSGMILLIGTIGAKWQNRESSVVTGLFWGSVATIIFTLSLVAWILTDFESIFYLFHMLSFDNNLWILDPSKDYLIKMFPQGFFNDAAIMLVCSVLLFAITVLMVAKHLKNRWVRAVGQSVIKSQ